MSAFAQGSVIFNNRVGTTVIQQHVYAPLAGNPELSQIGSGSNDFPSGSTSWAGFTLIGASATGQYSGSSTLAALLAAPGFNAAESLLIPAAIGSPAPLSLVSFRTGIAAGYTMGGVTATANNVARDGNATLEMVAWDNSSGNYSTWALAEPAWALGLIAAGKSGTFNEVLGGTGIPPNLDGLQSFNLYYALHAVPEPSTFALAGLGAAALLIFRRRK
jgi:hypothetical protein